MIGKHVEKDMEIIEKMKKFVFSIFFQAFWHTGGFHGNHAKEMVVMYQKNWLKL